MNIMKISLVIAAIITLSGCVESEASSDKKQQQQQERILAEGTAQTGMPAIKNFRERKLMKQIIEMRDQEGLVTYTYIVAEQTGKTTFVCNSIGYGLPAATQYTNPQKIADSGHQYGYAILPQADPNGLFSPTSAEGTWVMCISPEGKTVPLYVEPRVIVSPFKLN